MININYKELLSLLRSDHLEIGVWGGTLQNVQSWVLLWMSQGCHYGNVTDGQQSIWLTGFLHFLEARPIWGSGTTLTLISWSSQSHRCHPFFPMWRYSEVTNQTHFRGTSKTQPSLIGRTIRSDRGNLINQRRSCVFQHPPQKLVERRELEWMNKQANK